MVARIASVLFEALSSHQCCLGKSLLYDDIFCSTVQFEFKLIHSPRRHSYLKSLLNKPSERLSCVGSAVIAPFAWLPVHPQTIRPQDCRINDLLIIPPSCWKALQQTANKKHRLHPWYPLASLSDLKSTHLWFSNTRQTPFAPLRNQNKRVKINMSQTLFHQSWIG